MRRNNDKVKMIRQILNDKLFYNEYYGGLFIEFDHPFYNMPLLALYYNFEDISKIIPEKYLDKISVSAQDNDGIDITIIKFLPREINTVEEFSDLQTEFLDLMLELADDLPENPAWNKFTFPSDKSTKISSSTIN